MHSISFGSILHASAQALMVFWLDISPVSAVSGFKHVLSWSVSIGYIDLDYQGRVVKGV